MKILVVEDDPVQREAVAKLIGTQDVDYLLTYRRRIPALTDSAQTNWLITADPGAYLYQYSPGVAAAYDAIGQATTPQAAAAAAIDRGEQARVEIGAIKVVGARMLHNVIDRAVQVHGAAGLTDDTPLSFMYRAARFGRIYDGPDEVHVHTVARRILKATRPAEDGTPRHWEFAR